jgi:hypothetical protein
MLAEVPSLEAIVVQRHSSSPQAESALHVVHL